MEQLLADDKYQVVGFNLEYTSGHVGHDQKVVLALLCVGHCVLVYHYCLATRPCESFARFVSSPNYIFGKMDTTNDEKVHKIMSLACRNLVDIQCVYKILGARRSIRIP
ncbi:Serine/threonine-protein kinase [Hordeum vulgare]|nr:Serine/threonine-protein kinase [Hordeum vulgare]